MATKQNTPTPATTKPTKEMIQLVLASLSTEQLEQFRMEKLAATLEPLKQQYTELTAQLKSTVDSIREIDPTWEEPTTPTLAERILAFVTDQDKPVTKEDIQTAVGSKATFTAFKKLVEKDKTIVLKDGKYSVAPTV